MSHEEWRLALDAIGQDIARLEALDYETMVTLISQGADPTMLEPFEAPALEDSLPPDLADQATELHHRIERLHDQVAHALRMASQQVTISRRLSRTSSESHPQFIDTSI